MGQKNRNAWSDLADAGEPFNFALVAPIPPPSPLSRIHVLAYQQIPDHQRGVVLTIYDNARAHNRPTSAAAVIPQHVNKEDLVRSAGLDFECGLRTPDVQCNVWYRAMKFCSKALGLNTVLVFTSLFIDSHWFRGRLVKMKRTRTFTLCNKEEGCRTKRVSARMIQL